MTSPDYSKYLDDLDEKGYCVIPNLITKEECKKYIDRIWDWLEGLDTDIDRNEPATWGNGQWPPSMFGIIHRLSIGQEQFIWDLRQDPRVIEVFKQIWETDELLVSFDGMCILKPGQNQDMKERKKAFWAHTDQGSHKVGRHCIQGLMTLEEAGPHDGGLVVWPGTNKIHQEYFKEKKITTDGDWYKYPRSYIAILEREGYERTKVIAPAGSLILWDSRTIHQNEQPHKEQKVPRFRYAIYLCMTPASMATEHDIARKRAAFYQKKMTNHWPHQANPVILRNIDLSNYKVSMELPELTDVGMKLAGLLPY